MNVAGKPKIDNAPSHSGGAKDRLWQLRIWNGMCPSAWFYQLARNRMRIGPTRVPMALTNSGVCFFNGTLWLLQQLFCGRRIARTQIERDPVFVLGHWRSGTTLLHELLCSDPRHTYPDTFAAFAPNHFVFSRPLLSWWLKYLVPSKRPMDDMRVNWDSPQEEEWALCNMGQPSPYLSILFPNCEPAYPEYLDMRDVSGAAREEWKSTLLWYLKCVTARKAGRLVLKTPQHTCRVKILLEMFPGAKFIHIARNPYVIFPSTVKLWKRLYTYHGLQVPRFEGLEEQIFQTFNRMYEAFEEDRELLGPGQLCDVRYEDLVSDTKGTMRRVYDELALGDFEVVRPAVDEYVQRTAGYKPNHHELAPEIQESIDRRWKGYIERYGYSAPQPRDAETRVARL